MSSEFLICKPLAFLCISETARSYGNAVHTLYTYILHDPAQAGSRATCLCQEPQALTVPAPLAGLLMLNLGRDIMRLKSHFLQHSPVICHEGAAGEII